jgi:hypothetical protein
VIAKTAIVLVLLLLVGIVVMRLARSRSSHILAAQTPGTNPYLGLRDHALHFSREKVGIPAPANKGDVWGFLMDWGVDRGTATVVAMADGTASIYLSSGGGYLGGQGKEPVREAATRAVGIAAGCKPQAHPTSSYPLPERGQVYLYFLTDEGVFTASASQEELAQHRSPLSQLGDAAQEIITQFRKLQADN